MTPINPGHLEVLVDSTRISSYVWSTVSQDFKMYAGQTHDVEDFFVVIARRNVPRADKSSFQIVYVLNPGSIGWITYDMSG